MKAFALLLLFSGPAMAEGYAETQARRPDLFSAETGMRLLRYRAPTPDDIPSPARVADFARLTGLVAGGALLLDVYGARNTRYDELDGTWAVQGPRDSLPGAIWLPEVGRGTLAPGIGAYLETRLAEHASGRPVVVFCTADCWMSWNAARRVAALGYETWWWPLGVDGWTDEGLTLAPVLPLPVPTD